ncbi:MAG: hypothetical protein AAF266_14435, partial [Planctomycetota bacterium]
MKITRSLAVSFAWACLAASVAHAGILFEPNEDFGSATPLTSGVFTVSDEIIGGPGFPDLTLGAFDEFGGLIATDDDSSPLGNGLASALFGIPVNDDGSIDLAVSGFPDFDFDGISDGDAFPHTEVGDYDLFVDVFDASGAPIDFFDAFETLDVGEVDTFSFSDPAYIGGTFDVTTDNLIGEPGDVDFFRFSG